MSFTERYVHALWCDDVRQEIGNKPSFMGVYTGGLVLAKLPVVIPKLCAFAWVVTPLDRPIPYLSAKLIRDSGEVVASIAKMEGPQVPQEVAKGSTRLTMLVALIMANVQVPEGTKYFSLQVETESEILEGPKLFVSVDPSKLQASLLGSAVGPGNV